MSQVPIWSLTEKRHELDGASKGFIYLTKIGLGAIIGVMFGLLSVRIGLIATVLFVVLSKVVYYVRFPERSIAWDAYLDWVCDCALHLGWYVVLCLWVGEYKTAGIIFAAWLATYPWSCE